MKAIQLSHSDQTNILNEALLEDIQPYLGCTDISIIALGTALATQAAFGIIPQWANPSRKKSIIKQIKQNDVISITLEMNESLYKNAHATAIPNSGGYIGISKSASFGVFCNPEKKLNLFESLNNQDILKMKFVHSNAKIDVKTIYKPACNLYLYVKVVIKMKNKIYIGESLLQDSYVNIVFLKKNGVTMLTKTAFNKQQNNNQLNLDIPSLLNALDYLSPEVYERLEETIKLNTHAYEYGLKYSPGLGVGTKFTRMIEKGFLGNDVANQAAAKTAAAEDVRMGGENITVMGVSSSGSHGITSSIPILTIAEKYPKERKILLQSIALSFWITQMIKERTGFLSAPCGCVISSGIGATAGIGYYLGGSISQIESAINNFIISTAGVICDGGKTTCSIKLANAASTAVKSAYLALEGIQLSHETGGIVRNSFSKNIDNLVSISKGMEEVDRVITSILKEYQ